MEHQRRPRDPAGSGGRGMTRDGEARGNQQRAGQQGEPLVAAAPGGPRRPGCRGPARPRRRLPRPARRERCARAPSSKARRAGRRTTRRRSRPASRGRRRGRARRARRAPRRSGGRRSLGTGSRPRNSARPAGEQQAAVPERPGGHPGDEPEVVGGRLGERRRRGRARRADREHEAPDHRMTIRRGDAVAQDVAAVGQARRQRHAQLGVDDLGLPSSTLAASSARSSLRTAGRTGSLKRSTIRSGASASTASCRGRAFEQHRMGVRPTPWQRRKEQRECDAEPAAHGAASPRPEGRRAASPSSGRGRQPPSVPLMISSCGAGSSSSSGSCPAAGISIQRCTPPAHSCTVGKFKHRAGREIGQAADEHELVVEVVAQLAAAPADLP